MGCDIAGEGDDNTVVSLIRCYQIERIISWSGKPLLETSHKIEGLIKRCNPDAIVVDANGFGSTVSNYLKNAKYYVHEILGQKKAEEEDYYRNKRTELHFRFSEWLDVGKLPNHPELLRDIRSLRVFTEPNSGKLAIESKRVKGAKSTDYSDSVCLCFEVNPARSDSNLSSRIVVGGSEGCETGFDWSRFA